MTRSGRGRRTSALGKPPRSLKPVSRPVACRLRRSETERRDHVVMTATPRREIARRGDGGGRGLTAPAPDRCKALRTKELRVTHSAPFPQPNDLDAFWMPYTANRAFKRRPRPPRRRQGHALRRHRRPTHPRRNRRLVVLATPATAASRSSPRSRSRRRRSIFARRSSSATPRPCQLASRIAALAPGATSTTCSSPTPDPRPSTPR